MSANALVKTMMGITLSLLFGFGETTLAASDQAQKPSIEVVFVLDTTGSMGGLIEGAKLKIWSIANEMVAARPTPELRLGLIAYRDRGDQYITQLTDLSGDLDLIYEKLRALQAEGGGDMPESVNQALHEAVRQINWSSDPAVLKIIFLVGDAPPHMDYQDDVKYAETCRRAVKKDIIINAIQCGTIRETTPIWQEIARLAEGDFVQISQTGDMTAMETPMDEELQRLNQELAKTAVVYGVEAERSNVRAKMESASAAPKPAAADRMLYMSKSKKVVTGKGDLVADMAEGSVNLNELEPQSLPAELQNKSPEEQKAYLGQKTQEREQIQANIDKLLKQRETYLKQQSASRKGGRDTFDEKVAEIIRAQGKRKGIQYGEK